VADDPVNIDAKDLLRRHAAVVEPALIAAVATSTGIPPRLKEAITYSLAAGGKRLRPALVLECFAACGGQPGDRSALAAAVAIELIHTFSLVHDDLPAMDDDDLRRGVPTNHKVFGEAMAILAGDAMVTLAFETIADEADPQFVPHLVRELAHAAGPAGMIGGQVLDITAEGQMIELHELQQMHFKKTGALITAACRLGAMAAGLEPESRQTRGMVGVHSGPLRDISSYGVHIGLAFQIVDDILDVTSTPEQLGKHTMKDAGIGKNTYPRFMGLDNSRAAATRAVDTAISSLAPFGSTADGLRALARFVTSRAT